ncbi:MAG: hypothetical protein ACTHN4_08265 [Sphingomicrobium sp.]
MKNRTPVPREKRPPLPTFEPVPRRCKRHDGWTPERQKAFIEALADTGAVSRAAAMVNMSAESAYMLRRQKGAEEFRRAWEAALDFGVARLKDIAFERAISGYLVPMFVGGKLIGWRRKYNDRLLMFCLRHYGEDANGKRTKIEYFSTRAAAGAVSGDGALAQTSPHPNPSPSRGGASMAEASTTTVRTVISGRGEAADLDSTSDLIERFEGVELDEEARAAIAAVLRDCAARRREVAGTADDESEPFVAALPPPLPVTDLWKPRDPVERPLPVYDVVASPEEMVEITPRAAVEPEEQYRSGPGEFDWEMLDDEEGMAAVEEAVESVRRAKRGLESGGSGP